ncbi:hypothetical protein [Dethiobacter alkaliphilus]|uniref:hypothetical protein n=1 Tax=Dethiobacter alkaliphilus TaxID=427926 RepID=UPI0022276371|nr:hypothetical protein [Dethiobacter alkaliphilus]MCW3490311.1 hypothetical protein [Dethiobacter alkaliphilus]
MKKRNKTLTVLFVLLLSAGLVFAAITYLSNRATVDVTVIDSPPLSIQFENESEPGEYNLDNMHLGEIFLIDNEATVVINARIMLDYGEQQDFKVRFDSNANKDADFVVESGTIKYEDHEVMLIAVHNIEGDDNAVAIVQQGDANLILGNPEHGDYADLTLDVTIKSDEVEWFGLQAYK